MGELDKVFNGSSSQFEILERLGVNQFSKVGIIKVFIRENQSIILDIRENLVG